MSTPEKMLKTGEVAELIGIKKRTLEDWRLSKGIGPPFVRTGMGPKARVRYRPSDVAAWQDSLPSFTMSTQHNALKEAARVA